MRVLNWCGGFLKEFTMKQAPNFLHLIVGCLAISGAVTFGAQAQATTALPIDTPMTIGNVETVCTGVGQESEARPLWNAYPLKVVVAGKGGQYLAGEQVTVSERGKDVVRVACDGPWVLFKLAPGNYRVSATLDGENASSVAHAPVYGQDRVVLRFVDLGGATGPDDTPSND